MNKKFLSAILFGALMVTSTGTFVSCKDYDEEIEDLQGQISANTTAIAELKALIGDGNYVTSVSVSGQNLVVNTKKGSTNVPLPACEGGGVMAEVKDNQLFIDGDATGLYGESVKVVEGEWALLQADGTYKSTGIAVSGVTVTGDEKDGYILTIVDAEGEETVIELPTAASAITSLSVEKKEIKLDWFTFTPDEGKKEAWEEATGREVTSDRYIVSSETALNMRINPVTVDATEIDFTLVNGKNETMPLVELAATEFKNYVSRAAYGNGLYTLNVKPFSMEAYTEDSYKEFEKYLATTKGYYAVAANSAVRAEYNVTVAWGVEKTADFGCYKINDVAVTATGTPHTAHAATVKAGVEQTVTVATPSHLYDMYLTAKAEDINIFGIVFSADKKSFTITKSPDQVTAADFDLTVHTMDNNGKVDNETTIKITLSEAIDAAATYETRTLAIQKTAADNFFKADMATMKTALGANLDLWKRKVTVADVKYYEDAACTAAKEITSAGITMSFIKADGTALTNDNAGILAAADMKFLVDNTTASAKFAVNTVYYAKVSFSNGTEVLNSIVVPFQFTVPALSTFFEVEPAVFTEGVAYAYMNIEDQTAGEAAYKLSRAFKKYPEGVAIALNNETKIVGDYTSEGLADLSTTFTATAKITLTDNLVDGVNNADGTEAGYAKELIITATEATYENWTRAKADQTYTFKIKMMSPIFEGTISSVKTSVEIPVTSTEGYKMGNSDIEGKTYGAVAYKVFQDGFNTTGYWTRPEIKSVTGKSENVNVAKLENADATTGIATAVGATPSADGKSIVEGYLKVLPQNIENTTDVVVNLTVTDIWGYKKVSPITVTVKK